MLLHIEEEKGPSELKRLKTTTLVLFEKVDHML
jgi:hypothetical protein